MIKLLQKIVTLTVLTSTLTFADSLLIKNAKIHTLTAQGTLEQGDILIVDGKISSLGIGLEAIEGTRVIDASGKQITAGLMNAATALGLVEVSAIKSTVDDESTEKDYSASFSIAEVINFESSLFVHNRVNGLTHAMVIPDSHNTLFAGMGSLIQLSSKMAPVISADNAMYLNYGQAGAKIAGGSRAHALMKIKAIFKDVQAYLDDPKEFKAKSGLKEQEIKALVPMIKGEMPLIVSANKVSDLLNMLALKETYSLKMIISGGKETWKIADKLATAKIAVILDPYSNLPSNFESIANRIDSAIILNKAGVDIIFSNGSSHNAYAIRYGAGNAVGYGLPWDAALAAITKTPAKWFGLGKTNGMLAAGMNADLVIWDGDPLEVTTSVAQIIVQGKPISLISRQTQLRDRYLNKGDLPAAYSK